MKSSRAQIVATIGPASESPEMLAELIRSGIDVARLNFSWGTHEEHGARITRVREAAKKEGKHIPIVQDLSGPRMKTDTGHGFDKERYESGDGLLSEKDITDLRFGVSQNVEYVCVSYVSKKEHIEEVKKKIAEFGGTAKVIGKIERVEAVENAEEIIEASDAIMIGRGDLGEEAPLEQIPFMQKDIIEKCNRAKKPVITATQMMLSMVESPIPTRAEVTDVAYAIVCGTDAVMLSEETARGKYPKETVAMMQKIALEAEKHITSNAHNPF